ncbi:hypothetical protein AB0M39_40450 [Streptomyces sp. NPDC051907]|uniref:hypothetical protein n=1 Tax=Streptomyces sp. NPDC051907 TaxID=3155284 RepID=UPI003446EBB6
MRDPQIPYDSDADYSATALGSHWIERPEPETVPEKATVVQDAPPWSDGPTASVAPDRVEGEVLRFGPGVTAVVQRRQRESGSTTAVEVWHGASLGGQIAEPPPPRERRRRGLGRYALAATVLLAVLGYLVWERYGQSLDVRGVSASTTAEGPGCDGTADVVGVVETDGHAGDVAYRWVRSDGTRSELLREKVTRGQRQARLHLLWTFHGRGEYQAVAELQIVSPSRHTAVARFAYRCG